MRRLVFALAILAVAGCAPKMTRVSRAFEADGRFALVGLEGIPYVVRASIHPRPAYTEFCAEKRVVGATESVGQKIVMTLTRREEACRWPNKDD